MESKLSSSRMRSPPQDVAEKVHYQWFAGDGAKRGERAGLIPGNGLD